MFLQSLVEMGAFTLNHSWHGINMLSLLECALMASLLCGALAIFFGWRRKSNISALAVIGMLSFATAAYAANTALSALSASGALAGANLIYVVQTAGSGGVKATMTQVATFINSLFSGDCTVASGGAVTCTKTNGTAFGGLATVTPGTGVATATAVNVGTAGAIVVNGGALGTPSSGVGTNLTGTAAGLTAGNVTTNANLTGAVTSAGNATSLGSFSSANLLAALTTSTGTGSNVFGTAPTISSLNATTAATLAFITGSTQCLHVNTSGVISGTGSDCGSGSSTITAGTTPTSGITSGHFLGSSSNLVVDQTAVTSVSAGCGTSTGGSAITATGTVTAAYGGRVNATTSDTLVAGDCGTVVYESSSSNVAVAIAQAGTTGFGANTFFQVCDTAAGTTTITPATSTIGGASTLVIAAGTAAHPSCASFRSDGTNYTLLDVVPGSGVPAALGAALSGAGGLTSTIASGTAALGTGAISSATCATVVTATATGTATTDVVTASFNGDPTAVTGYTPVTTGALTIFTYPTANTFNAKVCNLTTSSITPGAITLNWRVVR